MNFYHLLFAFLIFCSSHRIVVAIPCSPDESTLSPQSDPKNLDPVSALTEIKESNKSIVLNSLQKAVAEKTLSESARKNIEIWLDDSFNVLKETIEGEEKNAHDWILHWLQQKNWTELGDRFFTKIQPGTAGMRGRMGVGSALINEATLGMFVQAHANYLLKQNLKGRKGIVIGGDSRHGSYNPKTKGPGDLQIMMAKIYAKAGIPVYLSDKPLPTPVCSFAINEIQFQVGELPLSAAIMTASHNSKTDNGYKIYEVNGHQVVNPKFKEELQKEINKITVFSQVNFLKDNSWPSSSEIDSLQDKETFKANEIRKIKVAENLFLVSSYDIIEQRTDKLRQLAIQTNENVFPRAKHKKEEKYHFSKEILDSIEKQKIVISALHGNLWADLKSLLEKHGMKERVHFFGEETDPNGDFPVAIGTDKEGQPNPEYKKVFTKSIKTANRVGAHYVFVSDPDSDRLGIAYKDKNTRKWVFLSGNDQLAMGASYLKEMNDPESPVKGGVFTPRDVFIKTLVSSNLLSRIIEDDAHLLHVHVGFKYFGQISAFYVNQVLEATGMTRLEFSQLSFKERKKRYKDHKIFRFIFGGEESLGMNRGDYVFDKDTAASMALFCELIGHLGIKKKTLGNLKQSLEKEHGSFKEQLFSEKFPGEKGDEEKKNLMEVLRNLSPQEINQRGGLGGKKVVARADYKIIKDINGNKVERLVQDEKSVPIKQTMGGEITIGPVTIPPFHVFWNEKTPVELDSTDYLVFYLEDGSSIHVRPSGTEALVKKYVNLEKKLTPNAVVKGTTVEMEYAAGLPPDYYVEESVQAPREKELKKEIKSIENDLKKIIKKIIKEKIASVLVVNQATSKAA
jgi:phosphomannomutase